MPLTEEQWRFMREDADERGAERGRKAARNGETEAPYTDPDLHSDDDTRQYVEWINEAARRAWEETWRDMARENTDVFEHGREAAEQPTSMPTDYWDSFGGPETYREALQEMWQEAYDNRRGELGREAANENLQSIYEQGYNNPDQPGEFQFLPEDTGDPFVDAHNREYNENVVDAYSDGQEAAQNGETYDPDGWQNSRNNGPGDRSGNAENGDTGGGSDPGGGGGGDDNNSPGDGGSGSPGNGSGGGSSPGNGSGRDPGDGGGGGSGYNGPWLWDPAWHPPLDPFDNPGNSPLVIDIDGDGVELVALDDSRAQFDLNMDGFAEHSGWVAPDDAFLAWDRDGDGKINDKTELFGDREGFSDGFAALADLDSNGDGTIDSQDSAWSELSLWFDHNGDGRSEDEVVEIGGGEVWRDLDGDGVKDGSELVGLDEAGLRSIDLDAAVIDETNAGHAVTHRSTVSWADGSTTLVEDVWFQNQTFHSRYLGEEDLEVDWRAEILPDLSGYGVVADLQVAMTLDPALRVAAEQLVTLSVDAEPGAFFDAFEDVLMAWTGAEDIDPLSRGDYMDARQLGVLEALFGRDYVAAGASDPGPAQAEALVAMYQNAVETMAVKFLIQSPLSALLTGATDGFSEHSYEGLSDALDFDVATDRITGDAAAAVAWAEAHLSAGEADSFLRALAVDLPEVEAARFLELTGTQGDDVTAWDPAAGSARLVADGYHTAGGLDRVEIAVAREAVSLLRLASAEGRDDLVITDLANGAKLVIKSQFGSGDLGVDSLVFADGTTLDRTAMAAEGVIRGDAGSNSLFGWQGRAEIFEAGAGDDLVAGGAGSDRYIWGLGDGDDLVYDRTNAAETDVLTLRDLNLADVTFERSGDDLSVTIQATGETLTVRGHFLGAINGIERVDFADGSSLSAAQILAALPILREGTDGDDRLVGSHLRDRFEGGLGDDTMIGQRGSDAYHFSSGDGNDVIQDVGLAGDDDVLVLTDLSRGDVELSSEGAFGDLVVTVEATGETIRVVDQGYTSDGRYGIETLRFADGSTLDRDEIAAQAWRRGTDGDDLLVGARGAETFDAGLGDDLQRGGQGGDTYRYALGDGNDRIEESGATADVDTLLFTDLTAEQVTVTRGSGSYADVSFTIDASGVSVTIARGAAGPINGLERIVFADGETWDAGQLLEQATIVGTAAGESLYGSAEGEALRGEDGLDRLFGAAGGDRYHWSRGDGDDLIYEYAAPSDEDALLLEGVAIADADLARNGNHLAVGIGEESVTVTNQFVGSGYGVERIVFDDGTLTADDWALL